MHTLRPHICLLTTVRLNTEKAANSHGLLMSGSMLISMSLGIARRISYKISIRRRSGFSTTFGLTSRHYIGYLLETQKRHMRLGYHNSGTIKEMRVFNSFSSRAEKRLMQFGQSSHLTWSLARSVATLRCSGYYLN